MLRERLAAEGVSSSEAHAYVMRAIYSLHRRVWWDLRLFFGGDPFTAEHELVTDLLAARTWKDVYTALQYYRFSPQSHRALFMRPRSRRVKRFVASIMGPQG